MCPGLSEFFLLLKNLPKIALNQFLIFWSCIPCVFCLYIYIDKICWLLWFHFLFCPCQFGWGVCGWGELYPSFILDFWNYFNFAKPLIPCQSCFWSSNHVPLGFRDCLPGSTLCWGSVARSRLSSIAPKATSGSSLMTLRRRERANRIVCSRVARSSDCIWDPTTLTWGWRKKVTFHRGL